MTDHLIASIPKNAREEIRVALSEFNGHNLASIRIWFTADDGSMRPGNKGLAVKLDKLPALIEALQQLETEARARGLVDGGAP